MLNLLGGLCAYCLKDEKPALNLNPEEMEMLERTGLVSLNQISGFDSNELILNEGQNQG